jgi:hypothetical protein
MSNGVMKWYEKQWAIGGYFIYEIYQVVIGNLTWYEATPKTPGCVTRTANTEKELRVILENDCLQIIRQHRKQRMR